MTGKRTVGVLGGMGPEATVDFMAMVIALTRASRDQDHVHLLVDHNPAVPDRQAALRGDRRGVSDALLAMARRLEAAGADFLVMPCNTAHAFLDGIREQFTVPFVDLIEETVAEAARLSGGTGAWGLLATTACVEAGVYQSAPGVGSRALRMPDGRSQSELMDTIFSIKAGRKGDRERAALRAQADALIANGAELIIAGCTEIPLVLRAADLDVPFVSSTEVLARRTVALACGRQEIP